MEQYKTLSPTTAWLFMAELRVSTDETTTPTWHLPDSSISLPFRPLWPLMSYTLLPELSAEAIVGHSLCCTSQETSGLLLRCPISSPIVAGQRIEGISPSKSHSPSCCALAAWHGDNEEEGDDATACSALEEGEVSEPELTHSPEGALCLHDSEPNTRGSSGARLWRSGWPTTAAW